MPLYEYRCEHGVADTAYFEMGKAPARHYVLHESPPEHRRLDELAKVACSAQRVYGDFQFTEDRTRLYRNPRTGTRFSDVLGREHPDSREERNRLYAEKGIEPVDPRDMPSQWKTALDYCQHRQSGGDAVNPETLVEKPDLSEVKSISQQLKESGIKFDANWNKVSA